MKGPFANRADEIRALRRRTPRYRIPFPDLTCEVRTAPCSNKIVHVASSRSAGATHPDAVRFPIGHSHKQGLELITPGQIARGELRWMSGRKT